MPVTLHEGASFLISRESGDIVPGEGRGLFHQDARFLRRLEVTLDGQAPVLLTARVPRETEGMHFLADSRLDGAPMGTVVLVRARCTGDLALVRELWGNVERALEWLQRDGDGFLEYASSTGLANQGWKDSFDSVRFREGTLATQPIALVEVQGYAFDALARCASWPSCWGTADRPKTCGVAPWECARGSSRATGWRKPGSSPRRSTATSAMSIQLAPTPATCSGRACSRGTRPSASRACCCRRRCSPATACARWGRLPLRMDRSRDGCARKPGDVKVVVEVS